jgi:hypothetical protein
VGLCIIFLGFIKSENTLSLTLSHQGRGNRLEL